VTAPGEIGTDRPMAAASTARTVRAGASSEGFRAVAAPPPATASQWVVRGVLAFAAYAIALVGLT
jgi:hypothetical protein